MYDYKLIKILFLYFKSLLKNMTNTDPLTDFT